MQFPMEILNPKYNLFLLMLFSLIMMMEPILATDPLSYALLSLKSEFIDNTNTLNDWYLPSDFKPSTQIYACSWTGVKCSQNSSKITTLDLSMKNLGGSLSGKQFNLFVDLVELNLSHNSFSGQLPVGIFNLTSLKTLDISRNNFSGIFPSGIFNLQNLVVLDAFSNSFSGPLPGDVSRIESLKNLNFAGSYFSGPIPADYGNFRAIEFIHLAGNFLSGNIPSELGNLKTLSHMEIGYNSYEGEIPWHFGNMSDLVYLDIADANISGSIPKEFSNLTKLESLFLFRNQINGKIPWEISKILTLKSLDLSDNLLSGQIPESFSELKNLRLLSLMYNDLSGPVPQGIAKLPQLDTLLIWNNYFTGSLPEDLGRFSRLKHLDVSTNYFVGNIPSDICVGGELQKLILFSNNFTGGLFPSISNCSSLVRLRLEDNSFSGEISLQFGNLPHISYVDLSRNRFTGGISSDVDQAYELQYFNVSYNSKLGGILPMKLWSLPNLQNFSMVSCGVSANIPPFENCKSVSVIELRLNNLSGDIPKSVSNCKHLLIMDLANNNLTGSIPAELASSSSLRLLNVSYNDISGSIPSNRAFKTMDRSAFFGNPKLCGAPLRPCRRENDISNGLELGSRRAQKLAWVLILCAVIVLFIMAAVFGIVYFKRGSNGQWKMVVFNGLPQFTAKDVLRSFDYVETLPDSIGKVVLPTGITVSAKKIEWGPKEMKVMLESLTRIGNARHENLTRLLGICYNNRLAYLLYDYLPNGNLAEKIGMRRDWETKCKILIGVARALCFLHHDCYPAIPHGNLKASNIIFDENMEPHLAEYGLSSIVGSSNSPLPAKIRKETDQIPKLPLFLLLNRKIYRFQSINIIYLDRRISNIHKRELYKDVYNFGELILEVLTNGRLANASEITQHAQREDLIKEGANENDIVLSRSFQEDVRSAIEVALQCTRSRPSDRPSMQEALKLLSGLKSVTNGMARKA
ncbi:hypothetical protein DH2020_039321 [Rehmannia glutinosa]|uniref:Protein kinase domain-containing protein n=1 Tax=Rehmannia glutinosa TaxID=99300 RepID=A0ABR0UW45_REHGL